MKYESMSLASFFSKINSEEKARDLLWRYRFGKVGFKCSECDNDQFFHIHTRPEVRQCKDCKKQIRLRAGTIMQKSHLPLLTWVRAIYLITTGKRGMSALELQRHLGLSRYETALNLTRKIRRSLWQRDKDYQLQGTVEVDGAFIGNRATNNQEKILVAIETKEYVDNKGKIQKRAGFAKIEIGEENSVNTSIFVEKSIKKGAQIKLDGKLNRLGNDLPQFKINSKAMYNDPILLDEHLPWVHRFLSNAKAWIIGTHHGVKAKYVKYYLAEYTYRFNRRHDVGRMFSRALNACCIADPITLHALTG